LPPTTSGLKTEWDYSGLMGRNGRKKIDGVRKGKVKATKR